MSDDERLNHFLKRIVNVHRKIYPRDQRDDASIAREMLDGLVQLGSVRKSGSQYVLPPYMNWDQLDAYIDQFERSYL